MDNNVIIDILVDKVNVQEAKIDAQYKEVKEIKEKIGGFQDNTAIIGQIDRQVKELKGMVNRISFPEKEVRELSNNLLTGVKLLANPVKPEVLHHHYVPKVTWIAAGLFLVVCLMAVGWYNTGTKLDQYKANDIAWRYFKLRVSPESLKSFHVVEDLYRKDPEKMKKEVEQEEAYNRQLEEAKRKAEEAQEAVNQLNRPVKKSKEK